MSTEFSWTNTAGGPIEGSSNENNYLCLLKFSRMLSCLETLHTPIKLDQTEVGDRETRTQLQTLYRRNRRQLESETPVVTSTDIETRALEAGLQRRHRQTEQLFETVGRKVECHPSSSRTDGDRSQRSGGARHHYEIPRAQQVIVREQLECVLAAIHRCRRVRKARVIVGSLLAFLIVATVSSGSLSRDALK